MAIRGNNILIYKNGSAIAGVITDEIQVGAELIEIGSPTSGQWKDFIVGRKSWSVSVSYLVLTNGHITDLLAVGNSYTLTIRPRSSGALVVSGTAILKTCKITATKGNLAQGSFQFQGTGQLS